MTPQQMSDKYAELAALHAARANGKTLQLFSIKDESWDDVPGFINGPDADSDLARWRVKPEPRRMWSTTGSTTFNEAEADEWRVKGYKVTEWVEVLP